MPGLTAPALELEVALEQELHALGVELEVRGALQQRPRALLVPLRARPSAYPPSSCQPSSCQPSFGVWC